MTYLQILKKILLKIYVGVIFIIGKVDSVIDVIKKYSKEVGQMLILPID